MTLFQETGYISNMEDSDEDDNYTHSSTIHDLTNEINQNSYLPSVSVSIFIILKILNMYL